MMHHPLVQLISSRVREFFREPEAIFWVYIFPIVLAAGLGLAFRDQPPPELIVGVSPPGSTSSLRARLVENEGFEIRDLGAAEGEKQVSRGKLDLLVILPDSGEGPVEYRLDPARPESLLARERVHASLQRAPGEPEVISGENVRLDRPGSRYLDFLFPGLIGMNLLGGGLFGIGFVIVDMRVRKLLKRFLATPMKKTHFFIAVLASRLVFLVPEMLFLLGVATLGFGLPVQGSWFDLIAVIFLGAMSFSGLGLLVATRARKLETISGLMNLVMLPMWLLGGIFFSTDRFPDAIQPLVQALPLTAINDALRGVILEGHGLLAVGGELLILGAWGTFGFLLSLKLFRWI